MLCHNGVTVTVCVCVCVCADLATDKQFIIYDLGVHALDIARFLLGDVETVYCRKQTVNPKIRGEDVATMLLGMVSGATCIVDVSYASQLEHETFPQTLVELEGERGSCRLNRDHVVTIVQKQPYSGAPHVTRHRIDLPDAPWMSDPARLIQSSVPPTLQHFADAIRAGTVPETSGTDNLKTFRVMRAAYASAESETEKVQRL